MKTDIKKILASKTKQALSSNILNSDNIRQNILVLNELKVLIPALNPDEYKQLEENIKQHGCQTPLQLWQTTRFASGQSDDPTDTDDVIYILIDGHNRLEICRKNNLHFDVYMLSFNSMKEAKDYMINLQLGRRNLSLTQISYLRGLRYNNEKTDRISNLNSNFPKGQNDPSGNSTAERLSKEYNVSPKTIKRDAEFAKGMEMLAPELRNDILSGKQKIEKKVIQQISKDSSITEPISDISKLSLELSSKESSEPTEKITQISNQIQKASERFVETQSQQDLETLFKLVTAALKLY